MSLQPRKTQKVFADVAASNTIAQFGSLAAGTPAYSNDPAVIQGLSAWTNGWGSAVVGTNSPALQDFNGFCRVVTQQLAYLLQRGVPEWDSATDYHTNCFVSYNGAIYLSLQNSNTGNNPATSPSWWSNYLAALPDTRSVAKGWVTFNSNGSILASYNVSQVVKNANGYYTIYWTNPMPSANYCVQAICGGNTNAINNYMLISNVSPMTANYVQLIERDPNNGPIWESSYICVTAFAG